MRKLTQVASLGAAAVMAVGTAVAHCDTAAGPIIPEAREALEKGTVGPVLKWVSAEHEGEVREVFAKALAARAKGPEAREVADRLFLETLIRLHRVGEGFPFTGIREEPPAKVIQFAEQAIAAGSADALVKRIQAHVGQAIQERLDKVLETRSHKDESVEAGRAYVAAYVDYMHFVEGVRNAVMAEQHDKAPAAAPTPTKGC